MTQSCKFICKRIEEVALEDIKGFKLYKETSGYLETYFKENALEDEKEKTARTYVIIDENTSEIVSYFSLKASLIGIYEDGLDTLPAIELSNFAVNDNYKKSHENMRDIGSMVFSDYIVPMVKKASMVIGVWGICIYALPYDRLIHFYQNLGFKRLPEELEKQLHLNMKPEYDQGCIFMFQAL